MRIARIEPFLLALPYEHGGPKPPRPYGRWDKMEMLLVRVETEDGVAGWGEAFGFAVSPVTLAALERVVAPLCVGRDVSDVADFMADLQRKCSNMGRNGPVGFALSGIDIALWDIWGKIEGKPLHRLLGGGERARVPAYASLLRYGLPELVARNVEKALAEGYRHVKLHEHTLASVAAARQAGGRDLALMLDTNCAWSADEAAAMALDLEEYGLFWLEEPIWPPDDWDALARLRHKSRTRIAAGENIGSAGEMRRMAKAGAVDVLQPSVTKIGGICEIRRAIAEGRAGGQVVMPHSPYFGPGLVATVHLVAASGGDMLLERFYCTLEASPLGDAILAEDGHMRVPQGPGLGVAVDEAVVARYRVA